MQHLRIFADAAGESHFEEMTLEMSPMRSTGPSPLPGMVSDALAATSVVFRHVAAGTSIDWHPAPQRQFVITLAGTAEFTTSDGAQHVVGPGSIVLAEDVTGKGHRTRVLPGEDWRNVWVSLAR